MDLMSVQLSKKQFLKISRLVYQLCGINLSNRKEALVKILGGHCSNCGYHKSISALSFHHKDPKTKSFDISNNGNLMGDWDVVLKEAKKCKLLCLNCHCEIEEIIRRNHP